MPSQLVWGRRKAREREVNKKNAIFGKKRVQFVDNVFL